MTARIENRRKEKTRRLVRDRERVVHMKGVEVCFPFRVSQFGFVDGVFVLSLGVGCLKKAWRDLLGESQ
jgi:hypothetical protein